MEYCAATAALRRAEGRICSLHRRGMSNESITREVHCSRRHVYDVLREM
jgi:AraC-like DNA-binding protein